MTDMDIRPMAEARAMERAIRSPENLDTLSPVEIRRLLHDLHVHQIELEIQNEEMRRAQIEIDAARARYFDLYDMAPVGYCTVSEKGMILEANLMAATLLGMDRGTLLTQPLSRFVTQESQDTYYFHRKRLLETGQPQSCELKMARRDAPPFWTHLTSTIAREEDGSPVCRVVITDISDRKQAEEALSESESRFRLLYEKAPLGYQSLNEQGYFIEVNQAWLDTLGYSREEVLGKSFADFLHPDWREHFQRNFPRFKAIGEVLGVEFEMLKKDGSYILVSFNGKIARDRHGNFQQTHCIFHDITERKRAEEEKEKLREQLAQAKKMESVGRLAGGVAHDFNNMLSVILGYAEAALDMVQPGDPSYAELREIQKAGWRSADLVRQLLAFARRQPITPTALNLNEIVEETLNMLRRLIGEHIDLVWRPGGNPWMVKMDPCQLEQILANLCTNARDAIAGVGKVTIETANVTLDQTRCVHDVEFVPGDYVLLGVSDDGRGMDKKTRDHLFEPFFTTKEFGKGSGLGLSTIYGIVRQNGGFIDVRSETGQGTAFRIYLPRHRGEPVPGTAEIPAKPAVRGHETILLVEDEPAMLEMTTMLLQGRGYAVLAANTPGGSHPPGGDASRRNTPPHNRRGHARHERS